MESVLTEFVEKQELKYGKSPLASTLESRFRDVIKANPRQGLCEGIRVKPQTHPSDRLQLFIEDRNNRWVGSEVKYFKKHTMETMKRTPELDRLAFTVLAIEASAQKMNISPSEMRRRLDKVGLIKSLIQDCYDTLHTESREAVANDVVEALKNWERE